MILSYLCKKAANLVLAIKSDYNNFRVHKLAKKLYHKEGYGWTVANPLEQVTRLTA